MDRAAYVTMDSTYNNLKTLMEEVEGAKEENVNKYAGSLEAGKCLGLACALCNITHLAMLPSEVSCRTYRR